MVFELNRGQVPDRGVEPVGVVPVDPAGDLPFDLAAVGPRRPGLVDGFGLEQRAADERPAGPHIGDKPPACNNHDQGRSARSFTAGSIFLGMRLILPFQTRKEAASNPCRFNSEFPGWVFV